MSSHLSHRVRPGSPGAFSATARANAAPAHEAPTVAVAMRSPEAAAPPRTSLLHISKLRGITLRARSQLKRQGITYTSQLLEQAGTAAARERLAARTGIAETELLHLARRADLARIKGVGAIFADMLELVGVHDVAALAARDPASLHDQLYRLNAAERFARRAPTPDEVDDWVRQARAAARLLDNDGH